MSLRLEMLQVARLAPKLLGDASELVAAFVRNQQNADGGFRRRSGESDLYYTAFGVDCLSALQVDSPDIGPFVESFGPGEKLDFVHLCCLARGWSILGATRMIPSELRETLIRRIEAHRTADGGFSAEPGGKFGSAYGCFMAVSALQDLNAPIADPERIVQSLKFLEIGDGSWANERNLRFGTLPPTAAAATVLRYLGFPLSAQVGDWLLEQAHPQGGFRAVPGSPVPDLLSTATALHALVGMQVSIDPVREACLDFIDTLWTNEGSFYGHWEEDSLDCEYTFYGLLALGHLAV